MDLDHRRLIRPGKIQAEFLAFDKFTLENLANKLLGACKPTFYTIYTSHLRWNSTDEALFLPYIQTSDRMQYFTILQYKLHSANGRIYTRDELSV